MLINTVSTGAEACQKLLLKKLFQAITKRTFYLYINGLKQLVGLDAFLHTFKRAATDPSILGEAKSWLLVFDNAGTYSLATMVGRTLFTENDFQRKRES